MTNLSQVKMKVNVSGPAVVCIIWKIAVNSTNPDHLARKHFIKDCLFSQTIKVDDQTGIVDQVRADLTISETSFSSKGELKNFWGLVYFNTHSLELDRITYFYDAKVNTSASFLIGRELNSTNGTDTGTVSIARSCIGSPQADVLKCCKSGF